MAQTDDKTTQYADIRSRFDEVLARHLNRLIEVDFGDDSLSFDLPTVTCLLLLVERERAVRDDGQTMGRFTKETFLESVSELGLEVDDGLMASFQSLMQFGYVTLDADQHYRAQIAAFALVDFFNNLFAGMPGIHLVSFVIQMVSEVLEGRKPLDTAIESFDKTLHTKGVPLSHQQMDKNDKASVKESVKRRKSENKMSREATEALRREYLQKLSALRETAARSRSQEPAVFLKGSDGTGRVTIRDVFPKADRDVDAAAQPAEAANQAAGKGECASGEAEPSATATTDETAEKDKAFAACEPPAPAPDTAVPNDAAPAAVNTPPEPTCGVSGDGKDTEEAPGPSVEDRIQAYEESLAMTCPICQSGKIQTETTEKHIPYYSCTNKNCGFISWGKPYAFACPACNNPFLIEFETGGEGQPGLKCPRAACSFSQAGLGPPSMARQASEASPQPQKRKKLVRVRRKK